MTPTVSPVFRATEHVAGDQRVVLRNVAWEQYESFVRASDSGSGVRTVYLDGELEIMSPSPYHEHIKTLVGRLVEAYADHEDLPLIGLGSTTFRKRAKRAGLEPDECYVLGRQKPVPDIAFEAVLTSGSVDKLEAYRRLGVREVWFWVDDELLVFRKTREKYVETKQSAFLPDLDLREVELILRTTTIEQQPQAVRAFRKSLARTKRR